MNRIQKLFAMFAITIMLAACGHGGGGDSSTAGTDGTVGTDGTAGTGGTGATGGTAGTGGTAAGTGAKTATVAFSVTSITNAVPLTTPVRGVTLAAFLPAGTTVATVAGSNFISSTALTAGAGSNVQVFGTYSAPINKVKIIVATTDTFQGGEFAKLTVGLPSTKTLTSNDFTASNLPSFPFFQAGGYDPNALGGSTSYDLTSQLQVLLGVTFN